MNSRDVFTRVLRRARDLEVDAVVHAGDVFDHENTRSDRVAVTREINRTVESGIPVYYIFGNHDDTYGRRALGSTSGIHLSDRSLIHGEFSVNLLGFDHCGQEFPTQPPDLTIELSHNPNILVIHESPDPVVDDTDTLLYQIDSNRADLSGFLETSSFDIDLVITGHLHVATQASIQGYDIPVLVTGPTVPISSYEKDSNPSTWLLTATESGIGLERQPV